MFFTKFDLYGSLQGILSLGTTLVGQAVDEQVDGRAYGSDLVGHFDQHTGNFGPSGFYANFYDEK